jgi:hypothetical protein
LWLNILNIQRKTGYGKSCVRFKKVEDIPFELIAELSRKMTVEDWISMYESQYKNKKSLEFLQFQGFLFAEEGSWKPFLYY